MSKPLVAIVGRPNVGKSMLFNKLCGRRLSIVEDTPGVTRDRLYAECEWCGRKFDMVDTGGIAPTTDSEILLYMREQAQIAINSATVIVLVTDIRTGVTAADKDVANMLLRSRKPVVLAVNKADSTGAEDPAIYEFYSLGLGDPIAVSAVHGHGTGDLLDECLKYFPPAEEEDEEDDCIKVAVIGKPNVGKSSLINRILGEKRLIVSDIAGTTRDAVDTMFENEQGRYMFIDTAGIRDSEDAVERLGVHRSREAMERAELVIAVVDGGGDVTDEDMEIIRAAERARKGLVVLSKADLGHVCPPPETKLPCVTVSSVTGQGLDELEAAIKALFPLPQVPAGEILTNVRQAEAISRALESMDAAFAAMHDGCTPDIVLTETEEAMSAIGELTGRSVREDVTNRIFERFCVGK